MKGFYIEITNNLLDPKHREAMGEAVWLYMWLLDKMTSISEEGIGKILGGKPIVFDEVGTELGISFSTYKRWVSRLKKFEYINARRTPYGLVLSVNKAKKRFGQKSDGSKLNERTAKDEPSRRLTIEPSNIRQGSADNTKDKEGVVPTPPSDVKTFIDFFFTASQKIQGVKPAIAGGKEGMLVKNKLKNYDLLRLQKLAVWYLSDRKQVRNQRNGEFEWRYRYAPSISAMMSSAFFNDILKEEHNPEFNRRFSDLADRVFPKTEMSKEIEQKKAALFSGLSMPRSKHDVED